jgi:hypothetical protein
MHQKLTEQTWSSPAALADVLTETMPNSIEQACFSRSPHCGELAAAQPAESLTPAFTPASCQASEREA